jgi:hypothetical protein
MKLMKPTAFLKTSNSKNLVLRHISTMYIFYRRVRRNSYDWIWGDSEIY